MEEVSIEMSVFLIAYVLGRCAINIPYDVHNLNTYQISELRQLSLCFRSRCIPDTVEIFSVELFLQYIPLNYWKSNFTKSIFTGSASFILEEAKTSVHATASTVRHSAK
jgi:hypothetical protein